MKALSVKMKVTLWYTGLIMAVLSVIFAAVLYAADDVLLLNLQDDLENEVYGNASSLELRRDGSLRRFTATPAALNCGATAACALTIWTFCMTA